MLVPSFLVLLDPHVPESLDALGFGVAVALVAGAVIDFVHAQSEHGKREELEGVLGSDAVVDFRKERVLGTRFDIGRRLKGTNGTLDCNPY
jgi:hypothetical protein